MEENFKKGNKRELKRKNKVFIIKNKNEQTDEKRKIN